MLLGTIVIGSWVGRQIKTGIIHESAATTALYLDSFVTPNLQELDQSDAITAEHFETLNDLLKNTEIGRQVVAIKVWDKNGQILFSNSPSIVGRTFTGTEDLDLAWQGKIVAQISDLQEDENLEERRSNTRLLEIYVPVRLNATHKIIAVAEFYQNLDELEVELVQAQQKSWFAVGAGMLGVYLWLVGFFSWTRNRIKAHETALNNQVAQLTEVLSYNDELDQRIRRAVANAATLNERILHRISDDLTSGPVQEINLALSQLEHIMTESETCRLNNPNSQCNENLPIIKTSLQASVQEISAIADGLGLPQLEGMKLRDVFQNVVQTHELYSGTRVSLSLSGNFPDQTTLPIKIAAYRIVQEALTNACRHANGVGQDVKVNFDGNELQIEISDQGPGFDPVISIAKDGHLGLVGMQERIKSLGGQFLIESKINHGSKIMVRLFLQNDDLTAIGQYNPV